MTASITWTLQRSSVQGAASRCFGRSDSRAKGGTGRAGSILSKSNLYEPKGQAIDVKQVGRICAERFSSYGGPTGSELPGKLIYSTTGTHLWADRFDGALEDVFELQDKVAISVAGVIEPRVQVAENTRSSERPAHVRTRSTA
jgi:hypothetical protein